MTLSVTGTHATSVIKDASTSPTLVDAEGTYSYAALATVNANAAIALAAKAGQTVCFSGTTVCTGFIAASGKWVFTNTSGVQIMSLDMAGNLRIAGAMTQGVTP